MTHQKKFLGELKIRLKKLKFLNSKEFGATLASFQGLEYLLLALAGEDD